MMGNIDKISPGIILDDIEHMKEDMG